MCDTVGGASQNEKHTFLSSNIFTTAHITRPPFSDQTQFQPQSLTTPLKKKKMKPTARRGTHACDPLRSAMALWALSTSLQFLYDKRFGQSRGNHHAHRTACSASHYWVHGELGGGTDVVCKAEGRATRGARALALQKSRKLQSFAPIAEQKEFLCQNS
jgi:hypothetical protein